LHGVGGGDPLQEVQIGRDLLRAAQQNAVAASRIEAGRPLPGRLLRSVQTVGESLR
jgi:hypothetical protein